jgi:hypothetical protein
MTTTTAPRATCPDWCKLDHERIYTEPGGHVRTLTPAASVLDVDLIREGDELGGAVVLDLAFSGNGIGKLPADPMALVRIAHDLLDAAEALSAITVEEVSA